MVTSSVQRRARVPRARRLALVLLGSVLLASCQAATPGASGGPPANESTFDKIKREKVVTVGFIIEPPYNFALNGQLTGGYPEALKAFFKTQAPDIQMLGVLTEFSALIPGLVAKRFDISGPGHETPERPAARSSILVTRRSRPYSCSSRRRATR